MDKKRVMQAFGLLLVIVLAGVAFVLAQIAGEEIPGSNNSEAIFEICNHTHDLKTDLSPDSKAVASLTDEYGTLKIPPIVERYDIVQFSEINLKKDRKNSLKVTVYGKEYDMTLERMNFETIDDGIDSYSGSLDESDGSVVLFTFAGNIVHGSVQLRDEMIFIEPIQNRENSLKTPMPLHMVYSSNDVKLPENMGKNRS